MHLALKCAASISDPKQGLLPKRAGRIHPTPAAVFSPSKRKLLRTSESPYRNRPRSAVLRQWPRSLNGRSEDTPKPKTSGGCGHRQTHGRFFYSLFSRAADGGPPRGPSPGSGRPPPPPRHTLPWPAPTNCRPTGARQGSPEGAGTNTALAKPHSEAGSAPASPPHLLPAPPCPAAALAAPPTPPPRPPLPPLTPPRTGHRPGPAHNRPQGRVPRQPAPGPPSPLAQAAVAVRRGPQRGEGKRRQRRRLP